VVIDNCQDVELCGQLLEFHDHPMCWDCIWNSSEEAYPFATATTMHFCGIGFVNCVVGLHPDRKPNISNRNWFNRPDTDLSKHTHFKSDPGKNLFMTPHHSVSSIEFTSSTPLEPYFIGILVIQDTIVLKVENTVDSALGDRGVRP
jgi:hypothetical protein